ncbi:MAG: EAL domain-containing protein [Crocosphaera sp.]|nr:EAL domain-containing protein [Crocosphaera sp.]
MSENLVNININQETWQKLHQYCQSSGQEESAVLEELISLLEPPSILENSDKFIQFQEFCQTIPVPILLIHPASANINYANPKALSILGFSLDTLLGLSLLDLCDESSQQQLLRNQLNTQNLIGNYELRLNKKDNNYLYTSVFFQPLQWDENLLMVSWCDITIRHQIEQELKEKKAFLQLVLDNIPQLIFWKDTNSVFLGCNRLWAKASGIIEPEQVIGKTDYDIYHHPNNKHLDPPKNHLSYYREQDLRVINTGNPELNFVEKKRNPEGQEVWYSTNKIPIKDGDGNIVGVLGTIENITERKLVERELFEEKELAKVTLNSLGEAVITTNAQGMIQEFNPIAQQLTGWTAQEATNQPISRIFNLIDKAGISLINPIYTLLRSHQNQRERLSGILQSKNGEQYEIDIVISPIRSETHQILGAVLIFRDITKASQLAHQLSWEASHDALTGLMNRRELEKQLNLALEAYQIENIEHILCYLDLDQFKIINDTCGHIAGDELLKQITRLLQARIRSSDILARLGGDEFALLLKGCSLEKAETIANNLRQLIKDFRFSWDHQVFSIGVSIGMVAINQEHQTITSVLNAADAACYAAKERGRNCVYVYQASDSEVIQQIGQSQWIVRLNNALTDNRFRLYSQKIISIQSPQKTHHEVLLRLLDESGNLISPLVFIPAAERYNLMAEIDQWVIRNFLKLYSEFEQTESQNLYTINLSAISLKNDQLCDFIEEQLSYYKVNPKHICFEITETTAITNLTQAVQLIEAIKQLGCYFALDDFGSGMSSLSYLKNLPVDYLKIDGSFVKNLEKNSVNYGLVDCFHRIGHVMRMETIAECVEDQKILKILEEIGVDYAQGYGIQRPIPLSF